MVIESFGLGVVQHTDYGCILQLIDHLLATLGSHNVEVGACHTHIHIKFVREHHVDVFQVGTATCKNHTARQFVGITRVTNLVLDKFDNIFESVLNKFRQRLLGDEHRLFYTRTCVDGLVNLNLVGQSLSVSEFDTLDLALGNSETLNVGIDVARTQRNGTHISHDAVLADTKVGGVATDVEHNNTIVELILNGSSLHREHRTCGESLGRKFGSKTCKSVLVADNHIVVTQHKGKGCGKFLTKATYGVGNLVDTAGTIYAIDLGDTLQDTDTILGANVIHSVVELVDILLANLAVATAHIHKVVVCGALNILVGHTGVNIRDANTVAVFEFIHCIADGVAHHLTVIDSATRHSVTCQLLTNDILDSQHVIAHAAECNLDATAAQIQSDYVIFLFHLYLEHTIWSSYLKSI